MNESDIFFLIVSGAIIFYWFKFCLWFSEHFVDWYYKDVSTNKIPNYDRVDDSFLGIGCGMVWGWVIVIFLILKRPTLPR